MLICNIVIAATYFSPGKVQRIDEWFFVPRRERESHHKAIEKIGFICVADRRRGGGRERRPMKSILTFISASIIVSVDASLREIPHPYLGATNLISSTH